MRSTLGHLCSAVRMLAIGLAVVSTVIVSSSLAAAGPRLEVHGASHFDVQAAPSNGSLAVSGTLLDDADRAIALSSIVVLFTADDGSPLDPRACPGQNPGLAAEANRAWRLTTEADGTFCVRAEARPGKTHVTLTWAGTRLFAGTHAELSVDASRRLVTLAFDPEPRVIDLGEGARVFDAVATIASDDAPASAARLALRLTDERGSVLGDALTDDAGRARFVVAPSLLGPAGPGELRLTFDGDARDADTRHVATCERRTLVQVSPRMTDGVVHATLEDDGAALDLDVRTAGGEPVPTGSVEGLFEGVVIGAASVTGGHAHLVARWPEGASTWLDARYVPEAPWYVAGPKTTISVVVPRTAFWRRAFILGVGAMILAAFVGSRSRLRLPAPRPAPLGVGSTGDFAHVAVIAAHEDEELGWEGRVVDAHERQAVDAVVVTLERGSFEGVVILAQATTDEEGRFTLPAVAVRSTDHLTAEGPLHGRYVGAVPASGLLEVALVSRRRGLVRRFVEWARNRGAPFDARPEPTPAHVRRMAGEHAPTAHWALAVEDAAFGIRPVDTEIEAEVDRLGRKTDAHRPSE